MNRKKWVNIIRLRDVDNGEYRTVLLQLIYSQKYGLRS
jgi:hypothetical protein